jgi:hypothetical protein
MTRLVDKLVPDDLWALVEPLLPPPDHPTAAGTTPSATATAWPSPETPASVSPKVAGSQKLYL